MYPRSSFEDNEEAPQGVTCAGGCDAEPGLTGDAVLSGREWMRFAVASVFAGQTMMFGLGLNIANPAPEYGSPTYVFWHAALAVGALTVLLMLGVPLAVDAVRAWAARKVTVESLFLLSAIGALGASAVASFTGRGAVYYEVVPVVLAVYAVGKVLAARSRQRALVEVARLREDFSTARVLTRDGERRRVPVASLQAGARVQVLPGEPICVDGVVVEGTSYVRETAMTGEPSAVGRGVGDRVMAGTWAVDGSLTVEVQGEPGRRRLDVVLEAVEAARLAPSALQAQVDRIVRAFVPFVAVTAVLTFAVWYAAGSPASEALYNSMAVLLVACPCALGLATPAAVWTGLWRLADMGLVCRTGDFIEALARVDVLVFDKTGTLSLSELTVSAWVPGLGWDEARLRSVLAAVEARREHPIARALAGGADERAAKVYAVTSVRLHPGLGLEAWVRDQGGRQLHVFVGERALMPTTALAGLGQLEAQVGAVKRRVSVAVNGVAAGLVVLDEHVRRSVHETFSRLAAMGVDCAVMTGDPNPRLPDLPGVAIHAGLPPGEKALRVQELSAGGRNLVFVGDGINDAAAMTAASASIAIGEGAALARSVSAAVLAGESLGTLPDAVELCRRVRRTIRANLVFAAAYNVLGMGLAAAGLLHPVAAAVLMVGSSVVVSARVVRGVRGTQPAGGEGLAIAGPEVPAVSPVQ